MVETPVGPERGPLADEVRDAPGQLDASRRRVLLLVQLGREPAEVVDGAGVLVAGDEGAWNVPVGGDAEDGGRLWQQLPQLAEAAGPVVVFDGVHRRAVADEEDGHALHDAV